MVWSNLKNETLIISSNWMSLLKRITREQIASGKLYGKGIDTYYGQNIKLNCPTL